MRPRQFASQWIWTTVLASLLFVSSLSQGQATALRGESFKLFHAAGPFPTIPEADAKLRAAFGSSRPTLHDGTMRNMLGAGFSVSKTSRVPSSSNGKLVLAYGAVADSSRASRGTGTLEYYGRRMPWAGPLILRVQQEMKEHPQVTRVLKMLVPAGD